MGMKTRYVAIWGILVFATLLEVVTRSVPATAIVVALGIIVISITKAVLIASVYQHLWEEGKIMAMLPAFALIALFLLITASVIGVM